MEKLDKRKIGKKLKEYRINRKLSKVGLAKIINVNKSTITRWEMGKYLPSLSHIVFLCNLYGVKIDNFILY